MIKFWLHAFAWKILEKEIGEHYIHRSHFNDYTQWMSRDFPIMEDMYEHFRKSGQFGKVEVARHREEMAAKYFPKIKS